MGLDTSHDAYHGGYGGFHVFRETLARATASELGVDMDWPNSIGLPDGWPEAGDQPMDEGLRERLAMGNFTPDEMPPEPIYVLLLHHDCDGVIPAFACSPLADQMERLLPRIDAETLAFAPAWAIPADRNTTDMAKRFVAGLRAASKAGQDLIFA